MQSLKELYKIGFGPSSSHTIGPAKIAEYIRAQFPENCQFRVTLFGSLALTGHGHGTDRVLRQILGENTEILFDKTADALPHPNTMDISVFRNGCLIQTVRAVSVGGGNIRMEGVPYHEPEEVYTLNTFREIRKYVSANGLTLAGYVYETEPDIRTYLHEVWDVMKDSVQRGLAREGILPGGLHLERKAKIIYESDQLIGGLDLDCNKFVSSYALAVAEENADNHLVVTAPTCGAAGVLPAVLYYLCRNKCVSEEKILDGLAVAGLIGNLVKTNASISGAECGCQAEIGTACSMAAAAVSAVCGLGVRETESAAEIAMEHCLGLTCDPVQGLVQMPCIERNAMAAMRAINSYSIARFLAAKSKVSFDSIVKTMYETGKDLGRQYRETAEGGLAKTYDGGIDIQ